MTPPDPVPNTAGPDQLKRSIDSLQRLYTIVVGLAVAEALRNFIAPTVPVDPWWANWRTLTIFLITIVPFYHGANGHLDQTYLFGVEGKRRENRYALIADFAVLFVEGILFFVLALKFNDFNGFVSVFAMILIADVLWAFFVHLTGGEGKKADHAARWGWLNLGAVVAIWIVYYSSWFEPSVRQNGVLTLAVLRMAVDYYLCWDFYVARYPMPKSVDEA